MKQYDVTILGATGAVGEQMRRVLLERYFPISHLRCLASANSAGKTLDFGGQTITIEEAREEAFAGTDLVLGAAENDVAERFAPAIRAAGALFVDNSSAFRLRDDVPLIIPEVNAGDIAGHNGILANPNCSTIIALMAVSAIARLSPITDLIAATYQAVSGAGAGGLRELQQQITALEQGKPAVAEVFAHPIAYNLIPQIGGFDPLGYTSEEMKMQNEGRKILHLPDLRVSCTCVRVPVLRSHSIAITLHTEQAVSVEAARQAIAATPGCRLVDDPAQGLYPMPLDTSDQDLVFVGRVREALTGQNGLTLWCCGDQIRKGAATNAVQIAQHAFGLC